MGKKGRRYGRRGMRVGKYVNLVFKVAGGLIAARPMIQAIKDGVASKDLAGIPTRMAYDYTGLDLNNGHWSANEATTGIGSIVVGLLVAKIGQVLGRRF